MARSAHGKAGRGGRKPATARRAPVRGGDDGLWARAALVVLGAALALRLAVVAAQLFPVHFDEAQYWAYGQELDWGYYSKPPLLAWLLRLVTGAAGDNLVALRLLSPVCHALAGWLIFLTGRRLWDGQTGFWAAAGYTAAPGVAYSAMLMSTDPLLLACWSTALYALVRAAEAPERAVAPAGDGTGKRDRTARKKPKGGAGLRGILLARLWWLVLGLAIGAGMLAKYTMIAFVIGAAGYGLFSARGRDWAGTAIAAGVALLLLAPNLAWNARHGFVTLAHVAGDADPGKGYFHPLEFLAFTAAQLAVIGPVFLIAILLAFRNRKAWMDDWGMRLVAWQTAPLLAAMTVLALATRANANWAAAAYVGGALMAARWLVLAGGIRALRAQLGVGIAASLLLWGLAGLYAGQADRLTRRLDPFVQTRLAEPFCELVLGNMAEEGAGVLLSDNRRRLSECIFQGGRGWDEVAIWNPKGRIGNQHEMVASLHPGDDRPMLLAVRQGADKIAARFTDARRIETVHLGVHLDRSVEVQIWFVQGFKGY